MKRLRLPAALALFAVLACGLGPPTPAVADGGSDRATPVAMPFVSVTPYTPTYSKLTIASAATVVFAGDSTSNNAGSYAWYDGGFTAALNAALSAPITVVNAGINGDHLVGSLATDVQSRVIAYAPAAVFTSIGTNDMAEDTETWGAAYLSYSQAIRAALPNCKLFMLTIPMRGEVWATGPVWSGNTDDAKIAALNAKIYAASLAVSGSVYVDSRSLMLQEEVDKNRTKTGTGVLTLDGWHMIAAGKAAMATAVMRYVTPVPRRPRVRVRPTTSRCPARHVPARSRRAPAAAEVPTW